MLSAPSPFSDTEPLAASPHLVYVPPAVPRDLWSSVYGSVLWCALQHRSLLLQRFADERDVG